MLEESRTVEEIKAHMPSEDADVAADRADRQSLIDLTDRYLAALVMHDPSHVSVAENIQTVENVQRIQPGEGLWATATGGPTSFAVYVPDPVRQSAGFIGVLERDGAPALLGLRLQLERGRIVEAEHLIAGNPAEASLAKLRTPRPSLLAEIPIGQRLPHQKLIDAGTTYYEALEVDNGSLSPFAAECERHENGIVTAGPNHVSPPESMFPPVAQDCTGQLDSKVFIYIDRIDNRRVFAADDVTGLTMGLSQFRHPMDTGPYEVLLADGTTAMFEPNFDPFDLPAAHIFKIGADGLIQEIEAMGFRAPYNSPSGWE